jgi:hypothetical protein
MEHRDLEEVERFLGTVGQPSLVAYYGLNESATEAEREAAVKKRRSWAQGQQSNPKYKAEALFLIKNNNSLRRLVVEQFDAYREHIARNTVAKGTDELAAFIRGALASGVLRPESEAAIRMQGRKLGLADAVVGRRIEEILAETGGQRSEDGREARADLGAGVDYYELLEVSPAATAGELEAAYRAKYRWARNLNDLKRSSDVLAQLDDAWRILRDPSRRGRYDTAHAEVQRVAAQVDDLAAKLLRAHEEPRSGPPPEINMEPPTEYAPMIGRGAPDAAHVVGGAGGGAVGGGAVSPPPAPEPTAFSGKTIGLADGPQAVRERAPRLQVGGSSTVKLALGRRAIDHNVVIRNVGQSRMPGKLVTDSGWLVPAKLWLEPSAREQTIVVSVRPERVPGRKATGTVTVVADHGERRVITFEVRRTGVATSLVVLFLLALAAGGAYFRMQWSKPPPPPAIPMLALVVEPLADRVLVDGKDLGAGARFTIPDPGTGAPFRLRVELEGFSPHEEMVQLGGKNADKRVTLELTDTLDWRPAPEAVAIGPTPAAIQQITDLDRRLARCVNEPTLEETPRMHVHAVISKDGQVRGLRLTKANFKLGDSLACMRRIFRAQRLSAFEGGDFAEVDLDMNLETP